ncbi:MAG TPA: ABC transporter substrate-binding protein [Vicinamibacterales bacterium]|nr:ABC transporter substrate-binding protein [Vicinamibacterales bacterium]
MTVTSARRSARGRRVLAVVALGAVALSAGACGTARDDPGYVVVGMTNSAVNLDSRVGIDEASQKAHQLLYNSLVRIDASLRVVPELAESLERPDPLTYVARIRRGVTFHDGRELTAEDVAYTFRSLIDPKFIGRTNAYRNVAAVDILDPYTVAFRLKAPFGSFPINLVMGIVQAGSGSANARSPVGTGPYKLVSFRPDDRIVLARFDEYFDGPAKNPGLVLKVVPDDTMRGLELRKGTVDLVVNDVSPDIVWQMQREGKLRIETAAGTDYAYVALNLRDPILQHVDVRRALGFAIDRQAIVKYLRRGFAAPAVGVLPPMSWAFRRDVFEFRHDPAEAARLLDAAGYPDPDGDGPRPRLTLTLKTSTAEVYRIQAAAIQQDLARVGVALQIRSQEFATLQRDMVAGNFQMYTAQFVGVTDPDMLRLLYHSSQVPRAGINRVHYRNPEVDGLIERASSALDDGERRALYGDIQQAVARDVPYIPLWYKTNVAVFQPDLQGVRLSPIADFTFLKDVYRARRR